MKRIARALSASRFPILWILFLAPCIVLADDCGRDITRAEDCMRTPGYAQGIAAAVATVVTVLVNGVPIAQTIFPPKDAGDPDNKDGPKYQLEIRSEDGRTDLFVDGEDMLWIYGRVTCDKPEVDTGSLTAGIGFQLQGPNLQWVQMGPVQYRDGFRAVALRAWPPTPESIVAEGGPSIVVSATIEGRPFSGPILLHLQYFQLDVTPMA
jgi:hypothetical protein